MSIKTIRPVRLKADEYHPFEKTLADNKLTRVPGTAVWVTPAIDTAGRVKSGIDEDSFRIRSITDEEVRATQYERRKKLRESLQERTGYNLIATTVDGVPDSPFYREILENGGYSLKDEDNNFDISNPIDYLNFLWLCESGIVARSYEDFISGKYLPGQILFYVFESDEEAKLKYERVQKQDAALEKLRSLTPEKRKKVAKLLGLGLADSAISEVVYNALRDYISLPAASAARDPLDNFNKFALLDDEAIDVEYLVNVLLDKNVVRSYGGVIKMGETVLARNVEDFKVILLDPKNSDLYESLREKLKSAFSAVVI